MEELRDGYAISDDPSRLDVDVARHPDLQGLRRSMLATRDAHALYRKTGYEDLGDPGRTYMLKPSEAGYRR